MVKTVRPKARATPRKPIPVFGNVAASTALPQPPKTSQNVPKNSAATFLPKFTGAFLSDFNSWGWWKIRQTRFRVKEVSNSTGMVDSEEKEVKRRSGAFPIAQVWPNQIRECYGPWCDAEP